MEPSLLAAQSASANSDMASAATVGRIPVRNIWLLMLYASDLYRELPRAQSVDVEDDPDELPSLVAELLTHAVERRMRSNLSFGYRRKRVDLNRVRGRIDLLRTDRHQLLQKGKVACTFEELTVDTPRNRFVKAALNLLHGVVKEDSLARRCRSVAAGMERAGVGGDPAYNNRRRPRTPLSRLGRLGADDRQMLAAARLAFDLALPTEDIGAFHLSSPGRDETWARRLFEHAVAGFYRVVLYPQGWGVSRGRWLQWPIDKKSSLVDNVLPSMQTDIVLERPRNDVHHRTIVDTKFTSIIKTGHHRDETLESRYIYQMYAYLMSQESDADPASLNSTGILLHPAVDKDFDQYAVIQGHKIRFATVNLAADSKTIRSQLLRIVENEVV